MEEIKAQAKVFKKALKEEYIGERISIPTPKGNIVIGELNYGDELAAERKSFVQEYIAATNEFIGKYDLITKKLYLILFSILEAPFEITIENLESVSRKTGNKIELAYNKLNGVSEKEGE